MANLVVFVELRGRVPSRPSRTAVEEARRLADGLGGTVYALLGAEAASDDEIEGWAAALGSAGADKVLVCVDATLSGPLDPPWGALLRSVCEKLRPRLFVFPAGRAGEELGPPLAVRMGAAYAPHAALELDASEGKTVLRLRRPRRQAVRELDVSDLDKSVVTTLASSVARAARPEAGLPVEAEIIARPNDGGLVWDIEIESVADPEAAATAACEDAAGIVLVAAARAERLSAAAGDDVAVLVADAAAAARLEACCPGVVAIVGAVAPLAAAALHASPSSVVVSSGAKASKGALPVTAVCTASADEATAALERVLTAAPLHGGA